MGISQRQFVRAAAGILLNRDQGGHASAFRIHAAHQMSGTLGSNHHYVHVGGWNDGFEMNAEAVGDPENFSRMQIGLDELVVDLSLGLVGREHMDPVGALGSLVRGNHDHAIGPCLLRANSVRVKTDDDFVSAVAKILRLRVSLAAIAEDGDCLAFQRLRRGVPFIENFNH